MVDRELTGGLALHGFTHLSVSTVGLFANALPLFILEKLMKRRGSVGASAHRGTSAETGIVHGLMNHDATLEECQEVGATQFDKLTALSADHRKEKERAAVPGIIASGLAELRAYGVPTGTQVKIERMLPGIDIPWLGYIDLQYDQHGLTVDIKSQLKLSSEVSAAHARQLSLYTYGTNNSARVAYCTPSKIGVYEVVERERHIAALVNMAQRMDRFLAISPDPAVLASLVIPNVDDFWYSSPQTRAATAEVYGL